MDGEPTISVDEFVAPIVSSFRRHTISCVRRRDELPRCGKNRWEVAIMGWTDERVEMLKKLWLDGHSASQIAK
ncbi:MAG: hypothetical protein M3T55_10720, partial [Pseudomonadota bacterium]|nr:hypothetical protein [Pseudomonadota bacterium]